MLFLTRKRVDFLKLLGMTSEGLEDIFEGDFTATCAKSFPAHIDVGMSDTPQAWQPGREDPNRREQNCFIFRNS